MTAKNLCRPLRILTWLGIVAGVTSCTPTINATKVSEGIRAELENQGVSTKAVNCPQNVLVPPFIQDSGAGGDAAFDAAAGASDPTATPSAPAAESSDPTVTEPAATEPSPTQSTMPPPMLTLVESLHRPFVCTGELEPEGSFPILVSRRTEQGQVQWAVPNSRQMLSLQELSSEIAGAIAKTTGSPPVLDCGTGFRVNRPNQSLECNASGSGPLKEGDTEFNLLSVRVSTDAEGNLSWQQVRQGAIASSVAPPTTAPAPNATGALPTDSGVPGGSTPADLGAAPPTKPGAANTPAAQPTPTPFPEAPFTSGPSITDDPGAAIGF